MYHIIKRDVPFIVAPNRSAVLLRKPTHFRTSLDSCSAQAYKKKSNFYEEHNIFICACINELSDMMMSCWHRLLLVLLRMLKFKYIQFHAIYRSFHSIILGISLSFLWWYFGYITDFRFFHVSLFVLLLALSLCGTYFFKLRFNSGVFLYHFCTLVYVHVSFQLHFQTYLIPNIYAVQQDTQSDFNE